VVPVSLPGGTLQRAAASQRDAASRRGGVPVAPQRRVGAVQASGARVAASPVASGSVA